MGCILKEACGTSVGAEVDGALFGRCSCIDIGRDIGRDRDIDIDTDYLTIMRLMELCLNGVSA